MWGASFDTGPLKFSIRDQIPGCRDYWPDLMLEKGSEEQFLNVIFKRKKSFSHTQLLLGPRSIGRNPEAPLSYLLPLGSR